MAKAQFFETPAAFRAWLQAHGAVQTELIVGFYKVGSGRPSITWPESVDEALCFGWIDAVRKRIDEEAYQIRFTRRKPTSVWSAVNIANYERLLAQGRITPAGAQAYALRKESRSGIYAYEQADSAELTAAERRSFKAQRAAWAFFENAPPSYRKQMLHWVTTAKKDATRSDRLARLMQACADGVRLR